MFIAFLERPAQLPRVLEMRALCEIECIDLENNQLSGT